MIQGSSIDAHVHVWSPDREKYPRTHEIAGLKPTSFTPEELLAIAQPCDISQIVLVQMSFYGFDHTYLLESINCYPDIFKGIGIINQDSGDPAEEMQRLAAHGVRGFRIPPEVSADTWLQSPGMRKMWRFAADNHLAICPLVNPEALPAVAQMCEQYPVTTVVIDHLARLGMHHPPVESEVSALCRLAAYQHVFVKISAFYALAQTYPYIALEPLIHRVVDSFGPSQLMWGSDSPFQTLDGHTYVDSLSFVRDQLTFLSDEAREWILQRTAKSLFFSSHK